jgi:hypothetical protein
LGLGEGGPLPGQHHDPNSRGDDRKHEQLAREDRPWAELRPEKQEKDQHPEE